MSEPTVTAPGIELTQKQLEALLEQVKAKSRMAPGKIFQLAESSDAKLLILDQASILRVAAELQSGEQFAGVYVWLGGSPEWYRTGKIWGETKVLSTAWKEVAQ